MSYAKIRLATENDGATLWVTLDAPPGNVLDRTMIESLRAVLANEARAPGLKALAFEGAGAHFSFGASIPEHRPGEVEKLLPEFHAFFRELIDLARPTVAVVRGRCLGGGLELALACHCTFASQDASFGLPEVRLGVFPPVGSLLLKQRLDAASADAMCLTGEIFPADIARDNKLIDHVSENPASAARGYIEQCFLPKSAAALHFATRAARLPMRDAFVANLERLERLYLDELMKTHDAREGIEAYLGKRPPRWKNE